MKKRNWVIAGAVVVLAALGIGYGIRSSHYQDRFLPKTEVLGVNVAGKTVKQADQKLKATLADVDYQLKDGGQTVATVSGKTLGLKRDYQALLGKLLAKQNPWGFSAVVLANSDKSALASSADSKEITTYATSEAASLNKTRTAPVAAKVVLKGDSYQVEKEQAGNQIDPHKLAEALAKAIQDNKHSVALKQTFYQPKAKATDKALIDAATKLEKIGRVKAVITITNHKEQIPASRLKSWLSYSNGAVQVDEKGVAKFVAELANKYNTYDKARQFKSTKRGTVTVPAGIYGWSIMQDKETAALIDLIKKGQDFDQQVLHRGTGYHADGADIGSTYLEIDKQNQHEWLYQNGKVVLDSPVVTGKPATPTPSGVFAVWSKQRNATLVGEDYRTPVSYWMPIDNTGVGLHDASWQPTFGGTWYQKHGSHGCINQPPSFIPKLWAAMSVGTPVIVF